jgi:Flp pilus assembly protein TadD
MNQMKKMQGLSIALVLCLAWVGLAGAHGDVSKLPESVQIEQYKLKIWMNPDDLVTRNKLAMAFYRSKQLAEAEEELRYILSKDAANFDALDGLGIVLIKRGQYKDALEYLQKAARMNEKDVMVHVHLSVVYEMMKLPEKAQGALRKAKSLASNPHELKHIEEELHLVSGHGHHHEH